MIKTTCTANLGKAYSRRMNFKRCLNGLLGVYVAKLSATKVSVEMVCGECKFYE